MYPNQYVDMNFFSNSAPNCEMTPEGVFVNTSFYIDFHLYPTKKNPDVLARLQMSSSSSVNPHIFNNKVVGELNSTSIHFEQISSKIGNFNPS